MFCIFFVYYTVMTGFEDLRLDLSIWIGIHIYIYFAGLFTNVFYVFAVYFYVKCVK